MSVLYSFDHHREISIMETEHRITIDFESFYSKTFSLGKIPTQNYILSEFFETVGVAVKVDTLPTLWFSGSMDDTTDWLHQFPWHRATMVAHNAPFDASILEWKHTCFPAKYFCTLSAARPLVGAFTKRGSVSLKNVSEYLGIGVKGEEVHNAIGMRRRDFQPTHLAAYGKYCVNDVDLCHDMDNIFSPQLPACEHDLIHETVRKFVKPVFVLNSKVLQTRLTSVKQEKQAALEQAQLLVGDKLMSNPKFAAALIAVGVEPPMKISPTTGKETFAFAKTDQGFQKLLEHPDPVVRSLVSARLTVKSTIEETRLEKFISLAATGMPLSVPLAYCGAHTHRFSGEGGLNMQNLPRGGELRQSLEAPAGYKVIAGDLSQIEVRVLAALAGQESLLDAFRAKRDIYCEFGSTLYNRPITKADSHERFIAKAAVLGSGYGLGATKFRDFAKALGGVDVSEAEAQRTIRAYRQTYPAIPALWRTLDRAIVAMATGNPMTVGPVKFEYQKAILPNGMVIHYPDLRIDPVSGGYIYTKRIGHGYLWGGSLTENLVQALARIILTDAELRLAKRDFHSALSVHDEIVLVVKELFVAVISRALHTTLTAPVPWMPDLPLDCDISFGDNYKECK